MIDQKSSSFRSTNTDTYARYPMSTNTPPASQGRHARYEKTQLGMWTSLGNDLSMREPKRQADFLKINRTGKAKPKQEKGIDYSDPMVFLKKSERKQRTKHSKSGRVAYLPLNEYNCPSIRAVAEMDRAARKSVENAFHAQEKMQNHTYAHNEGHEYEATSLGVYAILPKKNVA